MGYSNENACLKRKYVARIELLEFNNDWTQTFASYWMLKKNISSNMSEIWIEFVSKVSVVQLECETTIFHSTSNIFDKVL